MPKSRRWDGGYQRPDSPFWRCHRRRGQARAALNGVEESPLGAVGVTDPKTTDSETDPTKMRVEVD